MELMKIRRRILMMPHARTIGGLPVYVNDIPRGEQPRDVGGHADARGRAADHAGEPGPVSGYDARSGDGDGNDRGIMCCE